MKKENEETINTLMKNSNAQMERNIENFLPIDYFYRKNIFFYGKKFYLEKILYKEYFDQKNQNKIINNELFNKYLLKYSHLPVSLRVKKSLFMVHKIFNKYLKSQTNL